MLGIAVCLWFSLCADDDRGNHGNKLLSFLQERFTIQNSQFIIHRFPQRFHNIIGTESEPSQALAESVKFGCGKGQASAAEFLFDGAIEKLLLGNILKYKADRLFDRRGADPFQLKFPADSIRAEAAAAG
jgi:hypothetical protein